MIVGKSVRKTIDEWENGDLESAMLHACNAVDGTAKKYFSNNISMANKERFIRFLRENYEILGPMGAPGIDLKKTEFPINIPGKEGLYENYDIAEVIYKIHRCTHGHGDELPDGFSLIQDAAGPKGITRMEAQPGTIRLSDRIIFGLLAVAILSPKNSDQTIPDGYYLTFGDSYEMPINKWWGRSEDFNSLISRYSLPKVKLYFGNWMLKK